MSKYSFGFTCVGNSGTSANACPLFCQRSPMNECPPMNEVLRGPSCNTDARTLVSLIHDAPAPHRREDGVAACPLNGQV